MQVPIKIIPSLPTVGGFLLGCLTLLADAPAFAQCLPPHFRVGQDYGTSLLVSIQPRDFTLDKLTCLVQALRDRPQEGRTVGILFFDSEEAARYFLPPVEGYPRRWPEWAKALHAIYSFDADRNEESLDIVPMGYNTGPSLATTIALPVVAAPQCRLEIQSRCLMAAMEKITYPKEALRMRASGRIVLVGTIGRDGRVTDLHVAEAGVKPDEEKGQLVNAALQDLKTWQFDAAGRDDPIRIIYSFAIDTSRARGSVPGVLWVSPNQVKVRTGPPQ